MWPAYVQYVRACGVPAVIARVYRRYLKVQPGFKEDVIAWMLSARQYDDAALLLMEAIDDEAFVSAKGRSKHDLWTELLTLLIRHAAAVHSVDTERVIRSGIVRYTNDSGRLYCALASWHIRCGRFSRARDVYEEGIGGAGTVRDFTQVFDAYSKYEEAMLTMRMREASDKADAEGRDDGAAVGEEDDETFAIETDLDLSILRLEDLLARRPLLLSSVLLRQNPHNVDEWLRRTTLLADSPEAVIQTFSDAVSTVNPALATGRRASGSCGAPSPRCTSRMTTWTTRAWCTGRPCRCRTGGWRSWWPCTWSGWSSSSSTASTTARATFSQASAACRRGRRRLQDKATETVQQRVHRSTRLWALYADLEESLGTLSTTRAVYDAMIAMRVITPQVALNYAQLLHEQSYYEEAFRVYEQCIGLFHYPHVLVLWLAYLRAFTQRYKGAKRERTRDLFEQCLASIPAEHSRKIFLLYAKFEEEYGLSRRAMDVYARACQTVPVADRYALYVIYIARVTQRFGLTRAREVYEEAMQRLHQRHVLPLCLAYAKLELRLGEVDRARALYTYVSQWADAREARGQRVWREWEAFEVEHGNEETYREMLRVKRTVAAAYASVLRPAAAGDGEGDAQAEVQRLLKSGLIEPSKRRKRRRKEAAAGDTAARQGEVSEEEEEDEEEDGQKKEGEDGAAEAEQEGTKRARVQANPEEIDLGDIDEGAQEEEEEEEKDDDAERPPAVSFDDDDGMGGLQEKPVPDSLFGL